MISLSEHGSISTRFLEYKQANSITRVTIIAQWHNGTMVQHAGLPASEGISLDSTAWVTKRTRKINRHIWAPDRSLTPMPFPRLIRALAALSLQLRFGEILLRYGSTGTGHHVNRPAPWLSLRLIAGFRTGRNRYQIMRVIILIQFFPCSPECNARRMQTAEFRLQVMS